MINTTIETERLFMREFQKTDLDAFFEMIRNKEVYQWLGNREKKNREEAEWILDYFIKESSKKGTMILAVISKENNQLIGQAGVKYLKEVDGMEYFYALNQNQWNKGFATEMGRGLIDCYTRAFPEEDLAAVVYPENHRSKKVLMKLGFQWMGMREAFGSCLDYYELRSG